MELRRITAPLLALALLAALVVVGGTSGQQLKLSGKAKATGQVKMTTSGGGGGAFCSGSEVFCDDFDDNNLTGWTIDTILTESVTPAPTVTVVAASQELQLQPLTSAGVNYNGLVTSSTFSVSDRNVSIKAVQPDTTNEGGFNHVTSFAVFLNSSPGGNHFRIYHQTNQICIKGEDGNVDTPTDTCVAYNAVNHLYWRIRFDDTTNEVFFETSANRSTWTELGTPGGYATTLDMTAAWKIEVYVGTAASHATVNLVRFDDVEVVAN
jgi:hypothetical protein